MGEEGGRKHRSISKSPSEKFRRDYRAFVTSTEPGADGGKLDKCGGRADAVLQILGHPATAIKLRDRPLHNPPFRGDDKAGSRIPAFEDLRLELRADFRQRLAKHRALLGPIGKQLLEQRKAIGEGGEQQHAPIL
jgi:hypothetical protein